MNNNYTQLGQEKILMGARQDHGKLNKHNMAVSHQKSLFPIATQLKSISHKVS